MRLILILLTVIALTVLQATAGADGQSPTAEAVVEAPQSFDEWLEGLVREAREKGFDDELIEETLVGLAPLPRVIQSDRSQAELNPGFDRYVSARVTSAMVRQAQARAAEHRTLLARIQRRFDVQSRFLVAIWGMESRFGRLTGRTPVFRALATLAWEPRRAEYFRGELFNALLMVDRGHIEPAAMTGSWAGAMGQTQFMPSSYLKYAVDFDEDGRTDIWSSTADSLASIANYLKGFGWNPDETWGREVRVPAAARRRIDAEVGRRTEGCFAIRNMTTRIPLARWSDMGVTRADGTPLPTADIEAGLVDVGTRTFLVYPNYDAILGYNCAHYYALTIGLLSDRLR